MKHDEDELDDTGGDSAIFGSRLLSSALNPASLSFALIGLLITTFAASALYQAHKETLGTRFSSDTESIQRLLEARLDSGKRLMQIGGAFLMASEDVSDQKWQEFLRGMDLEGDIPGLQGMGFASISSRAGNTMPKGMEKKDGQQLSGLAIDAGDVGYATILLYETLSGEGSDLRPGRDLASNYSRREAIVMARDSGRCAIVVDPDRGGAGNPSFLFCLPVYGDGISPNTVDLRRKAIRGFVFAPIEVAGLVNDIFIGPERQIGFSIIDGDAPPGTSPIFTSSERNPGAIFQSASDLRTGGRFWSVETFSLASFENQRIQLSALFVAMSGIAITLLGMMILSDLRLKQRRATRIAQTTAESLRKSEAEIRKMNAGLEKAVATRTARLEEANEELRAFSYTVSHDLRAPARHVEALAGFIADEHGGELSHGANDYLARIADSAVRMQSLIEDILQLSSCSNTAFHPRRVDLTSVAAGLVATLECLHKSRTINVEIEPGLEIFGDPTVVRTTMQNLLDNAFKFTARQDIAVISVGAVQKNGERFYYVRDNGTGFDIKRSESIFQPFKRLHRQNEFEGTGVGLATVRKMIRRHGGEILVESELGTGTSFYFRLDAKEENHTDASHSAGNHHDPPAPTETAREESNNSLSDVRSLEKEVIS